MMVGLILFLSGTLGSFCWAQETAPDMNTLLKQGMDYYQSGNYAEAIRAFSDVLRLSVDKNINLRAHLYLGYTHFLQGESDKSRTQLEDAIKLNPQMILDDREFGPEFIKLFESAKKTVTGIAFIESVPKGATIWIDNEEIGLTPLKRELLSGKYRIKILKAGYTAKK
jgi:tetratricopeptide (TPR) repeat protein